MHGPIPGQRVLAEEILDVGLQQPQQPFVLLVVEDVVAEPQCDVAAARAALVGLHVQVLDGSRRAGARGRGAEEEGGERCRPRDAGVLRRRHLPGLII